jgi:4-aminobutyrate aminotransferase / (S)-3-amino-2-methylpropionate transaminase / 5-aminovalerate transaminase
MKLQSVGINMPVKLLTPIPGPESQKWMARRQEAVARGPFHVTPLFVRRAHGALLEDVDGNQLIDFAAGIGVVNVGHTPERVTKAIHEQTDQLIHASINVTAYPLYVELCEKLNARTPGSFKKKTFLANSGAEAVENAIKIARAYTGRTGVVCFEHAFHGRTYMAMALTYKDKPYKAGFGPFANEVVRAPFPYAYRWSDGKQTSDEVVSHEAFKKFVEIADASRPAAVIIEPVQGEGGFLPVPREFARLVREYCMQNNVVLIADEIQTGFGRTGTLYACEQLGIVPDLVTSAKGLGAGMPISAVTGRAEIMDAPSEGGIGGTYCGNPVACAAALAVFEELDNGVMETAQKLGSTLREKLNSWKEKYNCIGDVRGMGPMLALEFVKDRTTKEAYPEGAKALVKYCYERGLVIMTAGSLGNVVRLLMPLVIDSRDLEEGLQILESGIVENDWSAP